MVSRQQERDAFLQRVKDDFDARLAALASDPARWVEFIEQVAVFGARYSLSNQLLLMMQAEQRGMEPRYFLSYGNKAGTSGWLSHGRKVRQGEKAFKVWAPVKRRPTEEQARDWESQGNSVRRDPSGRLARQVVSFRLAATFDVSQTDGEPFEIPTIQQRRRMRTSAAGMPELLAGDDVTGAFDDLVSLIKAEGYGFDLAPPGSRYLGVANGITVAGDLMLVRVRDDVSPAQRVKTMLHELAHIRCGHLDETGTSMDAHRGRAETEAESVAHIVCATLGLDTAAYSDAYVLGWADSDMELVQQCAATVLRVAKSILADLTPIDDPNGDAPTETGGFR
ncbi:ArdC-like ssDNA-binding domain-containing protein [Actinoplanes sp. NPDC023714]|uniref:ArdC-like ssDNA-binding domain-containing protein n=1 Tax=Actinoplanes sp. NPDC023714 TaxID=3154322 RepID=UPI0033CB2865